MVYSLIPSWLQSFYAISWPGTLIGSILLMILITNFKNLPFIWHFRIVNGLSYVLRSQQVHLSQYKKADIFDAVVTKSHSPLAEIDFNLHKSNSTYVSDLDVARTHLVCTLFNAGIEAARFESCHETIGGGNSQLGVMLAAVSCSFKREISPYQEYEMWSRILCWDEKWFWVITWFVQSSRSGANRHDQSPIVFATALSKLVFKKGRKTIKPRLMMSLSDLLPESDSAESQALRREIEQQRQHCMQFVGTSEGLDHLHAQFDPSWPVLAKRQVLDFSPALLPRIVCLFGEWLWQRLLRVLKPSHKSH